MSADCCADAAAASTTSGVFVGGAHGQTRCRRQSPQTQALRAGADEYVVQCERHGDLASALNLPSFSVAVGYNYVEAQDLPPDVAADVYDRTGV